MNHKVQNVETLYEDAKGLYTNGVTSADDTSADTIIANLEQGINTLKGCWEGKDAGVQIQCIVEVHNAMVEIRNVLCELSVEASKIASNYREIQNANRANFGVLVPLSYDTKNIMAEYSDVRDTINITPEANNGKTRIDAANGAIDGFISNVRSYYDRIINNWTVGTGRENAIQAFDAFISKSAQYKESLGQASASISTAIKNYSF